jgi:hypothetical protein
MPSTNRTYKFEKTSDVFSKTHAYGFSGIKKKYMEKANTRNDEGSYSTSFYRS